MYRLPLLALFLAVLAGCSTPYRPPVFVYGGAAEFPGLAELARRSGAQPVDVVLVHGMCTHDADWAEDTINRLIAAVDTNLKPASSSARAMAADGSIRVISRPPVEVAGGSLRFAALVWSPLTAPLKAQLAYDSTGSPTDCTVPGQCKPQRARLNGEIKDGLLNDCLADAMIYEGASKAFIRQQMVDAFTQVLADSAGSQGPIVIVSESLGSKMTFDALTDMLGSGASAQAQAVAMDLSSRLALVFMGANQLPILGLADQNVGAGPALKTGALPSADSLQKFLRAIQGSAVRSKSLSKLVLIAFTDPNDLLSYRLQPSRYVSADVNIADVLVSNATTYLGVLERPDTAHTGYLDNADVTAIIACGRPKSSSCR